MAKQRVNMQQQIENIQHQTPLCHPLSETTQRKRREDRLRLKALIQHNGTDRYMQLYTHLDCTCTHSQDEEVTVHQL